MSASMTTSHFYTEALKAGRPIFAVAPMIDWTDRHCRYFHRQISRNALLYTEMVVADAIIHGPRERLLSFDAAEHPVALQLGGSDPDKLVKAVEIAALMPRDISASAAHYQHFAHLRQMDKRRIHVSLKRHRLSPAQAFVGSDDEIALAVFYTPFERFRRESAETVSNGALNQSLVAGRAERRYKRGG